MPTRESDALNSPADVLAAAFAALNLDDWAGFTDLCDPVSLRAFKTETLDHYSDDRDDYHVDADDLLETEPDMPREVAEYKAAKMNEVTSKAHWLKREFLVVESVDELRAMDPSRMFVLWLQACSPYRRAALEPEREEEPWESDSAWDPPVDDGKKETRGYRYSVLGCVPDGSEIAHVLYRDDNTIDKILPEEYAEFMGGKPADEQELARQLHHHSHPVFATCRKQPDGTWRLVAGRHLMLVSSLQRA
jgi:hypothetical protein